MTDPAASCSLPRNVTVRNVPEALLDDDINQQRTLIRALDLAHCDVVYIMMHMNEFERGQLTGLRFDQWPEAIRARMDREVAAWAEHHPDATVKGVTQGIHNGNCVLALHWRPKGVPA
ncbi:hypothetical protein ACWX0K_10835 [Nitrobacteraceae bacterium UC4446_H13]